MTSKADILQGRNAKKLVYVESLDREVELRPLTWGEWSEIEALSMEGIQATTSSDPKNPQVSVDLQKVSQAERRATRKLVAYGLSWSPESVDELPPKAVRELEKIIKQISEVDNDEIKKFRPQPRRSSDSAVPLAGDAAYKTPE